MVICRKKRFSIGGVAGQACHLISTVLFPIQQSLFWNRFPVGIGDEILAKLCCEIVLAFGPVEDVFRYDRAIG
jgi:hypothetical protein